MGLTRQMVLNAIRAMVVPPAVQNLGIELRERELLPEALGLSFVGTQPAVKDLEPCPQPRRSASRLEDRKQPDKPELQARLVGLKIYAELCVQ